MALIINYDNYKARVDVSEIIREDLKWWRQNIKSNCDVIRKDSFSTIIYTDASKSGWGAVRDDRRAHGFWNKEEKNRHINYLELKAIALALNSLASDLKDCNVLLRVDNTTAISYVNRMGGIRFQHFNDLSRQIWQWAEERRVWLFASYIPSVENVEADALSRRKPVDTEWALSDVVFQEIVNRFGEPEVDLFATKNNSKCKSFVSWYPEQDAIAVDAFTINWKEYYFYAFPPFSMILKTLQKIQQDEATGIVVVPEWTSQPWYPLFLALLVEEPLSFGPDPDLLYHACRYQRHPRAKYLRILVGKLSSSHLCGGTFQWNQ